MKPSILAPLISQYQGKCKLCAKQIKGKHLFVYIYSAAEF